ncbi:2,4'-dihydroxyacetophenone dioxygenase family protein [Mycobacterium syngnathidarum]
MALSAEPTVATTSSGMHLPLVALPQTTLLSVNEHDIPTLRDVAGPGVHIKPLRIDVEAGCMVALVTFSPGSEVPLHYHTGIAEVYTLSGSWHYKEYPDQLQTAGSYLYEPAASVHTLTCPESNVEDTVMLVRVEGAQINFTDDGQLHSILDAAVIRHIVPALAEAQGVGPVNYIGGGAADFTSPEN